MIKAKTLLALLAPAALLLPASLILAPVTSISVAIAQEKAKVSKDQASQNALQAVPGKITDITVERKLGKNVYVVEIVAEKDGEETDVLVDMDSGKVLGIEH